MKFVFLFLTLFLSACTEKKIEKEFNNNLKSKDDFLKLEAEKPQVLKVKQTKQKICQKADVKASKLDLRLLGLTLSKIYGVNINVPNNLDEHSGEVFSIDLNLENICLDNLLEELTDAYNIGFSKNNNRYTIYPPEVRTKIFHVNYHSLQRSSSSNSSVNSRSLDASNNSSATGQNYVSIQTKSEDNFWDNIKNTIAIIIRDDNSFSEKTIDSKEMIAVYKDTGMIVVRAEPRALKNVERFLQKINKNSLRQVVIEAKILEVTFTNEYSTGINWNKFANKLTMQIPQISGQDNISISAILTGRIGTPGQDFDGIINLLSSEGKVSVLSSPRVSALNNQRALIKFGTDSYYITNFSNNFVPTQTPNGPTTSSMQVSNVTFQPFFDGIALDTTAKIMNEKDVVLHIHPMITRVAEADKNFTINGMISTVPMAKVDTREADTLVKATSGEIIIIGGLAQNNVHMSESGLPSIKKPGLGKILSFFTTAKKKFNIKTELIILLRPTIVETLETSTNFEQFLEE